MNADDLYNKGLKSARAGDFYGAVTSLRLAASLGDESAENRRLMGKAYVHLGKLDRAEESFRQALAIDSRDGAAALCLATLRRYRIRCRAAAAAAVMVAAAIVSIAFWYPWQAYHRLDATVAAISVRSLGTPEAPGRSESAVPAAPRVETPASATPQPFVDTPSPPASGRGPTTLPSQPLSRGATPATPARPGIATPPQTQPPAVKPASSAVPQISPVRPATPQSEGTEAMFESRYREAVGVAFKGDLRQALALLSALSGDEYARQPLAGNVHFWMGRCLYELNQPREALNHFRQVLERYPNSQKHGEALIDLERCQRKLQTRNTIPPKQ